MKIYSVLAKEGIKKNKQIYFPYIISSICIIAITYITSYMSCSSTITDSFGGDVVSLLMNYGIIVMIIFATIFIFYTHSFLFKRRKKEFGLYNVLGLSKKDICRIVILDNVYIAVITIVLGLFCGILFSKFFELVLFKLLSKNYSTSFTIPPLSLIITLVCFIGINLIVLLSSIISVYTNNTIALLKAEGSKEKAPKANYLIALFGIIILGIAYYLAITIKDPVVALMTFFLAVIMVILATYLLFISGSVVLCKVLEHNKKYYYKINHFISVSMMSFRMKRNGAGIATICILSTMVLVMLSSTSSLYFGSVSSTKELFPYQYSINYFYDDYNSLVNSSKDDDLLTFVSQKGYKINDYITYHNINTYMPLEGNRIVEKSDTTSYGNISFVSVDEYNRLYDTDYVLNDDECLLFEYIGEYDYDSLQIEDLNLRIVGRATKMPTDYNTAIYAANNYFFVVNDLNAVANRLKGKVHYTYIEQFDVLNDKLAIYDTIINEYKSDAPFELESSLHLLSGYFEIYGSLFYLGITLSIAFMVGTVCIMYYKQVVEGYEDQKRFAIMKKVGLEDKQIRKSINSQLLTVFFLPLIGALIHLTFAYPMIEKLLTLFLMNDVKLFMLSTVICFVCFSIIYLLVYKLTSNVYYKIVN